MKVSAFANSEGGHLLIGAAEKAGVLAALPGFQGDADAELRQYDQIAAAGFNGPVLGLRMPPVALSAGGHVIVIRVPQSSSVKRLHFTAASAVMSSIAIRW